VSGCVPALEPDSGRPVRQTPSGRGILQTPIYLDHAATTPVDERVLARCVEVLRTHFGNPASSTHAYGWAAARLVEEAREEVAELIGATAREIVFSSGATESNNLALRGVAERYGGRGRHLVTSNVEHASVAAPAARLEREGWRVTRVPVGPDGVLDPAALAAALTPQTVLVSVVAAQNELGTLQPVREIGRLCKERVDAAQAAGKVPLDVAADGIDLLSLSGHKIYAPKGVGVLYVRRRDPRVALAPLQEGGGQERGLRAGTLNVPGIVALGEACRLARREMAAEAERLARLRERLLAAVTGGLAGVHLNGCPRRRLPGHLNLAFAGVRAHRLLGALTVLAVSSSSACSSNATEPSPVLRALGLPEELARASLRISLGRFTTREEVDFAAERIVAVVGDLRREAAD
jgi:cysteine desulfurase